MADGEGASKFIKIQVNNCKTDNDAKKIAFSIANSPLVKTAIAGEDPNWGRIIMAIGKAGVVINFEKLSIKFGNLIIIQDGKLNQNYDEKLISNYMKSENIEINVEIFTGKKNGDGPGPVGDLVKSLLPPGFSHKRLWHRTCKTRRF